MSEQLHTRPPRLEMRYGGQGCSIIAPDSGIATHDRYGAIAVTTRENAPALEAIVRAVNSHAALVDALKAAELELREIISFTVVEKIALRRPEIDSINVVAAAARAALKAAGVSS